MNKLDDLVPIVFESFRVAAREHCASANVEPGRLLMYNRRTTEAKRRVLVSCGGNRFVVTVPDDLGRSLRTVFGEDRAAREALLAQCFLRARLATLPEAAYLGLGLDTKLGPYSAHLERMDRDGSVDLASALCKGFGHAYEALLHAVEKDVRVANGFAETTADRQGRSDHSAPARALVLFATS